MIGVLHPGDMGAAVAGCLLAAGHRVAWAGVGRSAATRQRALVQGLVDVGDVPALVAACDVLVSVCPPHAALDVARQVAAAPGGFGGIYLDANAVSPATAMAVHATVTAAGARYVDGGLVGPPPTAAGSTRLFLSGPAAQEVAALLRGSNLEPVVLGGDLLAASALKMAYASWTKGTVALLLAVRAAARAYGVEDALVEEWARSQPALPQQSVTAARLGLERGWRWSYELAETGRTLAAVGLPDGFGAAAAQIYRRLADAADSSGTADLPDPATLVAALDRLQPPTESP